VHLRLQTETHRVKEAIREEGTNPPPPKEKERKRKKITCIC
jgi:hypothetical protein